MFKKVLITFLVVVFSFAFLSTCFAKNELSKDQMIKEVRLQATYGEFSQILETMKDGNFINLSKEDLSKIQELALSAKNVLHGLILKNRECLIKDEEEKIIFKKCDEFTDFVDYLLNKYSKK